MIYETRVDTLTARRNTTANSNSVLLQGPMYNNRPAMNQGYPQQHGCYGQFSPTSQRFPSSMKQGNPSVSQSINHQVFWIF